jgi:hypothetical protein
MLILSQMIKKVLSNSNEKVEMNTPAISINIIPPNENEGPANTIVNGVGKSCLTVPDVVIISRAQMPHSNNKKLSAKYS